MAKRDFRPRAGADRRAPELPTLEAFDGDRRAFLGRLGAAVGLGALGSALSACGARRVHSGDGGGVDHEVLGGDPLPPPTQLDAGLPADDGGSVAPAVDARVDPDVEWPVPGEAPAPDARADAEPDWGLDGDVAQPDARVDAGPDWGLSGGAPAPDARADPDGMAAPGFAPAMDARVDAEECPN